MIQVFDIENGVIKPTPHCYTISWLKAIMDKYPKDYIKVYGYIFYMTCPNEDNPYLNMMEDIKEERIIDDLQIDFSVDSYEINNAIEHLNLMFETPTMRSYKAFKSMLDKLSDYLMMTEITDGKEGNIADIVRLMKDGEQMRQTYKSAYKDLQEEQVSKKTRGGEQVAYDQR